MNECELNVAITAITNYLYSTLDEKDFLCASILLSEVSKSMFSMALLRDVCKREREKPHRRGRGKGRGCHDDGETSEDADESPPAKKSS